MPDGVTRTVDMNAWDIYNNYVERDLDGAAYSSAHPDDILVVAGPARLRNVKMGDATGIGSLMALGQLQMGSVSVNVPVQPTKALGSSRKFYLVDSTMTQIQLSRLVMNARNLQRALYHSVVEAGISVGDVATVGAPTTYPDVTNQQWWINLDCPIYRIPIGLGFLFRDRGKTLIGGMYAELCLINNWSVQFASGQAGIVESVSIVSDTLKPFGTPTGVSSLIEAFDEALNLVHTSAMARDDASEDSDNLDFALNP